MKLASFSLGLCGLAFAGHAYGGLRHAKAPLYHRKLAGSSAPFDLVIVMDESGSMGGEHTSLQSKVPALFSGLTSQAPGSRVGLVGYGYTDNNGAGRIHTTLTSDASVFGSAVTSLQASGGEEPAHQTVIEITKAVALGMGGTVLEMDYTENRPFCVALFTDEDSDGPVDSTLVAEYLLNLKPNQANAKGTFFAIVDPALLGHAHYTDVVSATGGAMFNMNDFLSGSDAFLTELLLKCNFAVNQITLLPSTHSLPHTGTHNLVIGTNELFNGGIIPIGTDVKFEVLSGPGAGTTQIITTDTTTGEYIVQYSPSTIDTSYQGGQVDFQVSLQSDPTVIATASAVFTNLCSSPCPPTTNQCTKNVCNQSDGQCYEEDLPNDTICSNGQTCTWDTCQNGLCVSEHPLITDVSLAYTQNSLKLDFSDSAAANVLMDFTYAATGVASFLTNFEAIVFDDATCQGDIIAMTQGALLLPQYQAGGSNEPQLPLPFEVAIGGTPSMPELELMTPITEFNNPFWTQYASCSDSVGGSGNPTTEVCGLLEYCVEFQAKMCDRKVNFASVNVEVELALEVDCDTNCGDVLLQADTIVEDGGDASAQYPIECYPCDMATNSPLIVNQGETVDVCMELNPNVNGACILEIDSLQLEVMISATSNGVYSILPTAGADLFLANNGVDLDPPFNPDGAMVGFLPPGEEFQELQLLGPTATRAAHFSGTVILGLGCYCDGSCSVRGRKLQETDQRFMVRVDGEDFDLTLVREEDDDGCTGFFLFCWIGWILDFILGLFN